jgi:L-methionine (R)-S-oxide reductase
MNSKELLKELDGLLTGFWLTDLSNFSAHFFAGVPDINWIGFYLTDGERLRLGPFAGKIACTEIEFDRGICGAAFTKDEVMNVPDVHKFPGHIACDSASRSELVLPFDVNGELCGVLDIDSPLVDRFSQRDVELFTKALEVLTRRINYFPSFHESSNKGF